MPEIALEDGQRFRSLLGEGCVIARASLASALLLVMMAGPLAAQAVSSGNVVTLRGLDRLSGSITDLEVPVGGETRFERLQIAVSGCRFPTDAPSSDAFAFLRITDSRNGQQLFRGWMIASAPALNALDDARFDVWVLSCSRRTGGARASTEAAADTVSDTAPQVETDPAELAPLSSIRPRQRPLR